MPRKAAGLQYGAERPLSAPFQTFTALPSMRYLVVGMVNTAIGYAIILLWLKLGAGDYISNAAGYVLGLMLAYLLHRRWTFALTTGASFAEAGRFGATAATAYAVNVGVIYAARTQGYIDNPPA